MAIASAAVSYHQGVEHDTVNASVTRLTTSGLEELRLRYYFYYQSDVGVGGHKDDLEGIDVYIKAVHDRNDAEGV